MERARTSDTPKKLSNHYGNNPSPQFPGGALVIEKHAIIPIAIEPLVSMAMALQCIHNTRVTLPQN